MFEQVQDSVPQTRRRDGGFTLIELLVVIVILGILSAIVVFAVGGITDKGDASAKTADLKTVQTAEEAFFANQKPTGTYTGEADLVTKGFLAQVSTLHDVCLKGTTAYKIIPAPATDALCVTAGGAGFAYAP